MTASQHHPLLIIGKNGTLGRAFAKVCEERCLHHILLSRKDCDISNQASIEAAIGHYRPWGIINAAGYVRVDDAEREKEACMKLYISNLGPEVTDDSLALIFSTYGRVRSASISRDPAAHSGFALVEMPDPAEARMAAHRMNGKIVNGMSLSVREALPSYAENHPAAC